jgi:hypothetical protein
MALVELGQRIRWSIDVMDLYRLLKQAEAMGLAKEPAPFNFAELRWSLKLELFGLFGFLFEALFSPYSRRR